MRVSSRTLKFLLPASAVLLTAGIGCSHPIQVDLPPGYTGKVSIFCESFSDSGEIIRVGQDGVAPKAACSRSREAISIVRGGQPVQPVSEPRWATTGDGIVLGIEFEVR